MSIHILYFMLSEYFKFLHMENYILEHYNEYKVNKCIKLVEYNIGETEKKLTIPYYLAFLLQ